MPANTYQVAPTGSPWQFSGSAGISTDNSGLTSGTANAPQGSQAGFIMNNGSMGQTVYLDADTYNLSFLAAQRVNQTQSQTIEVLVDRGKPSRLITPSTTDGLSNTTYTYTLYETSNFTVAAGSHTIDFLGIAPTSTGSTAFLDEVTITATENTFSDGDFESPVLAAEAYQIAPAVPPGSLGDCRGDHQSQRLHHRRRLCPRRGPGRLHQGRRQHEPSGLLRRRHVQHLVRGRAAHRLSDPEPADRGRGRPRASDQQVIGLITPAISTDPNGTPADNALLYLQSLPNVEFHGHGRHAYRRVPGHEPGHRRQHGLHRQRDDHMGCAIADGSFEEPAWPAKPTRDRPSGHDLAVPGDAGVSTDSLNNKSGMTAGNPVAPDGYQVAFIPNTASISQSVYMAAGIYNLSFMAAQPTTPDPVSVDRGPGRRPGRGSGHSFRSRQRRRHLPAGSTLACIRRRISGSRRAYTPSCSSV